MDAAGKARSDDQRSQDAEATALSRQAPPHTPDGRYIIVRDRLWRAANPELDKDRRAALVADLMNARRAVRAAQRGKDDEEALQLARAAVDRAKHGLGERGEPWWDDGAPDLNRRMVRNTLYARWWDEQAKRGNRSAVENS